LEALANLLALAKSKRAKTTLHGRHDTRYIEASHRVWEARDAIDRHSQSWMTPVAKPSSADNEDPSGQAPNVSAPPPRSTTHRFTTRRGNEGYRASARTKNVLVHSQRTEEHIDPRSQSWDLDNGVDHSVNFVALMVHEAREANKGLSPENTILTRIGTRMPHPESYSGEPDLERFQVFIAGLLRWLSMNQLLGSDP